jgi:glycosyltransferase involved in cell wall biosynthesis
MKVLIVTPSYYPILGGTETYVRQLTQKLNQKGVDADVMTLNMDSKWRPINRDEILKENGFSVCKVSAQNPRVFNFHKRSLYSEFFNVHVIPRLSFSREFDNYDIIHFQDDTDFTFPFFSYIMNGKNKPTLLHFHTLPYTYHRYKRNLLLGTVLKRVADVYIGISTYTMRFMLDLGLPEARLVTLPNGVDTETFRPNDNIRIDNLVLWVGRIIPEKGLEVLLKALFQLKTQTQVIVIGPTDPSYLSLFSEIQHLMRKINDETEHKVTYLGPLRGSALIEWYQRAAIFAAPAHTEHFGITYLEALACGTPVIATRVGGIPDVIKDGVNGLLIPPNEPLALASALGTLLKNTKLRESYGRNGRVIAEECFSWNRILDKLVRIYRKLLEMEM